MQTIPMQARPSTVPALAATARKRGSKALFLKWLRATHLYVGLWGAVLGLLFGATGILLNHRSVLKIPVEKTVQKTAQLALPADGFSSPQALADWLLAELKFRPGQIPLIRVQAATTIRWGETEVKQPMRWHISLHSPQRSVNAEYFVGNRFVALDHVDATPIGTLTRMHMAVGASAFWVLLADTIAGGLIVLSITGLLLWTQLHRNKLIGMGISLAALMAALWITWGL